MSARPVRASKQRAIENMKKLVAEMNTYDDNGVLYEEDAILHAGSSVKPSVPKSTKITLEKVKETYVKSSYSPKILALIPKEFRHYLLIEEDDRILGECIYALDAILCEYSGESGPATNPIKADSPDEIDYVVAYNFYRHYSEEAIEYILNQIEEFEGCQEYDEDEEEHFMEKHYPATSRSYADKPDAELIKALMEAAYTPELIKDIMGAAYTPEAFAEIMKKNNK
jgi:hypothetical protein